MNISNSEIVDTIKAIESIAPDGYGRMSIPCETDDELYQKIEFALQSGSRAEFLLNQNGVDSLLKFIERMASQCLREPDFEHCSHAAEAVELILSQPCYDEKMLSVALALIHDAYNRLSKPRPAFDWKHLPKFHEAWNDFCTRFELDQSIAESHFRIGTEHDGLRYICYW